MIAIISNTYIYGYILFILIISSQLSLVNCNAIDVNKDVVEKRVGGSLMFGKSDSHIPSLDTKMESVRPMTGQALKHRSSELNHLIGLPPIRQKENIKTLPMPNMRIIAGNRKPTIPQMPVYQMPFEGPFNQNSKNYYSVEHQNHDEVTSNVIDKYFKKYDLKKYFLKKILGDSYEEEGEEDEGFFGGQHLKRHGAAGMAAKIFGELIGIKIRESIEDLGKTVSDYAKELTSRGFVSIGNAFFRFKKIS